MCTIKNCSAAKYMLIYVKCLTKILLTKNNQNDYKSVIKSVFHAVIIAVKERKKSVSTFLMNEAD